MRDIGQEEIYNFLKRHGPGRLYQDSDPRPHLPGQGVSGRVQGGEVVRLVQPRLLGALGHEPGQLPNGDEPVRPGLGEVAPHRPVELLGAGQGEYIADLCAAPGGKSTQIAGRMQGEGILVCNEYVPARAEILAQNMERMGILNCVILKESVDHMAERFPLFFDRVLVDAPCSGSGMFRKEEEALLQWSPENVRMCAERQMEILEHAARMVRPGGVLVYSTCSFSEAEDEGVIERFLQEHKEFALDEASLTEELLAAGICPGRLPGTVRMWPHKLRGEGHFAARLVKAGEGVLGRDEKQQAGCAKSITSKVKNAQKENQNYFQDFCQQYLTESCFEKLEAEGNFVWKKEFLFFMPALCISLSLPSALWPPARPSHAWQEPCHAPP